MTTTALSETEAGSAAATELVVFRIDKSEYALPVENVAEILRMVAIAPVPEAPEWLPGVVNLRGKVIPVIDLRTRLGLPRMEAGLNTPIIVAETDGQLVGLVADSVTELLSVPLDSVEPPDARVGDANAVEAVARAGERLLLIFDLERVCAGSQQHLAGR
ncbi:MAG TPA: chemotaxis protein CheW [Thermoleophilaceae bacterium]|nr:chemotaxis protein CheW [Thermoleophilaceae bacterium]